MGNIIKADCAIFAAGSAVSPARVREFLQDDAFIIAADAGYKLCHACGLQPNLVIGDFDSGETVSENPNMQVIRLNPIKDDTDTACAYTQAVNRGYKNIVLFGGTGGRLDHTFANFDLCAHAKTQGVSFTIIDDHHEIFALQNETRVINGDAGKYVSVFAVGGACTVSLRGLAYPLENYTFAPFSGLGVSNETTAEKAEIEVQAGTALIFVTDKIINTFFDAAYSDNSNGKGGVCMRRRSRGGNLGLMFAMLGAGLILALVFPSGFLVVALSLALIVSGILLCKNC